MFCANKIHFILPFAGFCESIFGDEVVPVSGENKDGKGQGKSLLGVRRYTKKMTLANLSAIFL